VAFWYRLPADLTGSPQPGGGGAGRVGDAGSALRLSVPNPIRGGTATIRFSLPHAERDVVLEMHDVGGRRIATLGAGPRSAGPHEVAWNAEALPAGIYFLRLRAGEVAVAKKVVRLR
jgi:hypothetical protein